MAKIKGQKDNQMILSTLHRIQLQIHQHEPS